jgi:hypothetical protein
MKRKPFRWQRQIAWLVATFLAASSPAVPQRGRGGELSIAVTRIGRTEIGAETKTESPRLGLAYYYVSHREPVVITLSRPLPPRARLYPLVRRAGGGAWTVQQAAIGPGGRNARGEWKAEVRLGEPSDTGSRFEVLVIAAAEPLPPAPLPEGLRMRSTLAESAVVPVERRRGRPTVGVSAIGGARIYGDEEVEVHDIAKAEVVARDLPDESVVGLVVHPTTTDQRWVMVDLSGEGTGEITTYFGTGKPGEDFFRYTVFAFVAWADELPPRGKAIPSGTWEKYQERFLTTSRRVRVIRWEAELRIREIGGVAVLPGRILVVGPQEDVHGAVQRKLQTGERIWLVCIPSRGDPWVAGWTSRLHPSGKWVVNAASLWQEGKPTRFDVVAVLSAGDATRIQPQALRAWVHNEERPHHSTRLQIGAADAGKDKAPAVGGRRP